MSTYVIADIHGCYKTFLKLLEKVDFTDEDTLYINGDIMDRGEGFYELYKWVRERDNKNVFMTLGNHELGFLEDLILDFSDGEIKLDSYKSIKYLREAKGLTDDELEEMFEFYKMLPLFYDIKVDDKRYIIVHAYASNYSIENPEEADEYECTWERSLAKEKGWDRPIDNTTIIFGHTPTINRVYPTEKRGFIYREKGVSEDGKHYEKINIDCGCVWGKNGNLGMLRLEDMQEFYEKKIDGLVEEYFREKDNMK